MVTQVIHVLAIEDDPQCRLRITNALSRADGAAPFELTTCTHLDAALERLAGGANDFDVILLDIDLPDSAGLETISRLHEAHPDLPIVVLAGADDIEAEVEALHSEAQEYLNKGGLSEELIRRTIRHAIERNRSRRQLRESESRIQQITKTLADYVYTVRLKAGTVAAAVYDPRCLAVTGHSPEEFAADPDSWTEIVHEEDQDRVRQHIRRILSGKDVEPLEYRIVHKNGEVRWIKQTPVRHFDQAGALISYDGFIQDISERKRREEELERSIERVNDLAVAAEAATQSKSEFLANMSHEIRTPLNAIIGYADIMRRQAEADRVPAKHRQAVNGIHTSGQFLSKLIDQILDLSRIEAGKLQMDIATCDPWSIVSDVVSVLNVRAVQKGIELTVESEGPIPATVQTDHDRLRQCLMNLVGNAVKFTSEGSVRLSVRLRGSAEESFIRFDVGDTGIGISQDRLNAIFEPFTQAERSTSRKFGGTGLGLAISRQIARALGGDITASSVESRGSIFTLEVPTGSLEGVELRHDLKVVLVPSGEPAPAGIDLRFDGRILVAEDSLVNRDMLVAMLADLGVEIATVKDGQAAVWAVGDESYDLILMDWQMPVMDGLEATQQIRASGNQVPIIALTANAMRGDREMCLQAGCTGYLSKPVDYEALLAELQKYLEPGRPLAAMDVRHAW